MHERVAHFLNAAGWSPNRRVDPSAQRRCLLAEAYPASTDVLSLLEEFGSLEIAGPRGLVLVDACSGVKQTWRSAVRYWSARVGAELSPVGTVSGHGTLVCSENLQAYVGFGEDLVALGLWPDQALEALLADGPRNPVPLLPGLTDQDFVRDDDP